MRCSHGGSVIRSQVGLVVVDFFFKVDDGIHIFFGESSVFFVSVVCYLNIVRHGTFS